MIETYLVNFKVSKINQGAYKLARIFTVKKKSDYNVGFLISLDNILHFSCVFLKFSNFTFNNGQFIL